MARSLEPDDQLALDEKVVDIPELVEALEARQEAKADAGDARKVLKAANERANAEIEKLELPEDTAIRAGRFRITRRAVASRQVSFETDPTTRVTIAVVE